MPSPDGKYHPARQAPGSSSFVLGRRRRPRGRPWGRAGGLRALQLDPGSGGWSKDTGRAFRPTRRVTRRARGTTAWGRGESDWAARSGHGSQFARARHRPRRRSAVPERAVPAGQGAGRARPAAPRGRPARRRSRRSRPTRALQWTLPDRGHQVAAELRPACAGAVEQHHAHAEARPARAPQRPARRCHAAAPNARRVRRPPRRAAADAGVRRPACGTAVPIMQSRVTSALRASSVRPSVPAGRIGTTR